MLEYNPKLLFCWALTVWVWSNLLADLCLCYREVASSVQVTGVFIYAEFDTRVGWWPLPAVSLHADDLAMAMKGDESPVSRTLVTP